MTKRFATRLQLFVSIALVTILVRAAHADVVMDWNAKGDAIAEKELLAANSRNVDASHRHVRGGERDRTKIRAL